MEKLWAVVHWNGFDGELTTEFHRSNSWHGAMAQHSKLKDCLKDIDFTTRETAKQSVWNWDDDIDVKEVPQ